MQTILSVYIRFYPSHKQVSVNAKKEKYENKNYQIIFIC